MEKNGFQDQMFLNAPFACVCHEILHGEDGNPSDYRFIAVNEAFEKLTGLHRENLIGREIRQAFPDNEKSTSAWIDLHNRIDPGIRESAFEHYLAPLDRWFLVNTYHTDSMHIAMVLTDINAYKQKKDLNRIMAMQWQAFWDNELFGVMIIDKNGKYLEANDEACRMTGYRIEELRQMSIFDIVDTCRPEEANGYSHPSVMNGKAFSEGVFRTKNGERKWWKVVATKISDDQYLGFYEDITGRKRAEEKIVREHLRFQHLFEHTPSATWLEDLTGLVDWFNQLRDQGVEDLRLFFRQNPDQLNHAFNLIRVIDVNPAAIEQNAASSKEQLMANVSHLFEKHTYNEFLAELEIIWQGQDHVEYETQSKRLNGQPLHVIIRLVIPEHEGRLDYSRVVVTGTDITGRKQAEEELRQNRNMLGRILNTIPQSVFWKDKDSRYQGCNIQFALAAGLNDPEEVVGKTDFDLPWPKTESVRYRNDDLYVMDHHVSKSNIIEPLYHADGSRQWIDTTKIPLLDSNGDVYGVLGVYEDITKRKLLEEERESALLMLQSALAQSPSGILIADAPDVRIRWANEAALGIRGQSEDPLTGIDMTRHSVTWQTFRLDGTPMPSEELPLSRSILHGETVRNEELIIRHTTGEDRFVSANSAPIRNAAGEITAGIVVFHDITEIKKAEKALKESAGKYQHLSSLLRLLADNMPDMLWAKNLQKEFIFTNKAICDNLLNAIDTEEPLGKNDMFFAMRERNSRPENPEWHTFGEICRDSDALTIEAMKPMQFDEFGNVQGKFLFLDVHKAPLYDEKGEVIGVVGSARDVTASKEAEKQLRKLSQAVEQSPASVVIANPEGIIEYVNPKFTEITGYSPEEAIGQNSRILKSGELPVEFYTELWKTITSGNEWKGEFHNKKKNGELFWESSLISPIKDENGKILHYLAVKEDITERKELEARLKNQTRFRELLMEISSGFINIHFSKLDESINEALGKMACFVAADRAYTFDYEWQNGVCHNTYEWCAREIRPEIANLQNLPLSIMTEWVDAHKNGEPKFVYDVAGLPPGDGKETLENQGIKSFLTVPMMNEGVCIGFVGFDSVKEQHFYSDSEVQLLKLFAQLLTNVKLRKEMVEQLVSAKTKAEESDRLKTHFMNNISHEIRTPLNGIIGFGDLIMDESISTDEKQYYHHILNQSSARLMQTITDIMDIAELKADSLVKNPGNMDILLVLTRLTDEIRFACSQKNIVVTLELLPAGEKTILRTDEELFRKIVQHLLSNAVKFTGSGRITVGFTDRGDEVECYVRDTGKGISPDKLETIFEPFMQEDVRNTRGHEGNGLGLAIARGMVKLLGGKLWVESTKGEGSTFYFTIPRNEVKPLNTPRKSHPAEAEMSGNPVVLIAEDDESSAQLIQVVIQKAGLPTLHAWNGEEAVDLCRRYPEIKLVFMDIKMPVMNGLEATARIKEFRPGLPVIALTAHAQSGDRNRVMEAGCDDYFVKPLIKSTILEILQRFRH